MVNTKLMKAAKIKIIFFWSPEKSNKKYLKSGMSLTEIIKQLIFFETKFLDYLQEH